MKQQNIEQLEKQVAKKTKRRSAKSQVKMKVSGASVKKLAKIIGKK